MYSVSMHRWILSALCAVCLSGCASISTGTDALRQPPKPFRADGCTLFPDGDYRDCCDAHDFAYWCGGTRAERKQADRVLAQCVAAKGHAYLPALIHRGVRIGGVPWLPTYWRWGFGWPFGRGYSDHPEQGCTAIAEPPRQRM